jgi:hypothetical protein
MLLVAHSLQSKLICNRSVWRQTIRSAFHGSAVVVKKLTFSW